MSAVVLTTDCIPYQWWMSCCFFYHSFVCHKIIKWFEIMRKNREASSIFNLQISTDFETAGYQLPILKVHIVTTIEHWNNADIINLLDQQSANTNLKLNCSFASQSVDRTQCTRNNTYVVRTPKKPISGRFSRTTSGRKMTRTRSIKQQLSIEFYSRER